MMSRRLPLSIFKSYNNIISFKSVAFFNPLLSSSLPTLAAALRLNSSVSNESLHFSKIDPALAAIPIDKILTSGGQSTLSGKESVALLKALRIEVLFNGVDSKNFKNDPKFENLCNAFMKDCSQMHPSLLISGLRSLLEVGVPPESNFVVSAEKAVITNISQFSTFNIVGCLYSHYKFIETDLQKEVVSKLIAELGKSLSEIQSASELLMLMHINYLFDDELKKKVELLVTKLIPKMDVHEMSKVICTLSETSNRNLSILNVLSFYIRQKSEDLSFKDTIDLCYALKNLNFFDPLLYKSLFNKLETEIPSTTKPSLISGILTIWGHAKWKDAGLLNACELWIKTHFDVCKIKEFRAFVLTVGALNHVSFQTKSVLELIIPHLTLENIKSPNVYLDIAWALSAVDCIPKEMLLEVLTPSFYQPLLKVSESPTADSITLKLLNLKGILKILYPECVFGCDLFLEPPKIKESVDILSSRNHVIKVLSNIVPKNNCMSLNQVNDAGLYIDAEFILNKDLKPVSLKEYGILSDSASTSKPLPSGHKRIAFLILFLKDYTVSSNSLTGSNALRERILTHAGYKVVHMRYNEFALNKTEVDKAKYLLKKIKTCIMDG